MGLQHTPSLRACLLKDWTPSAGGPHERMKKRGQEDGHWGEASSGSNVPFEGTLLGWEQGAPLATAAGSNQVARSLLAKVQALAALLAIAILGVAAVAGLAVSLRSFGAGKGVL